MWFLVTAIGGKPKPEIYFLPGRLKWALLPKERFGDSLSGRGSNVQPSNWEADILPLINRYPIATDLITRIFLANYNN